jgi:hypothetical protein
VQEAQRGIWAAWPIEAAQDLCERRSLTGGKPVAARRAYAERPAESKEGAEILSSKANTRTLRRLALAAILSLVAGALLLVGPAAALTDSRSTSSGSDAAAAAGDPDGVSFALAGCRNDGTIVLPIGGQFVCPDTAYTQGNLGKGWNELDLVPLRVIADAGNSAPSTQTYTIATVVDAMDGGHPGFDVISAPVLNTALSAASCSAATATADTTISPGLGGTDVSRYRKITITQANSTTCVYDFYARLALGSHLYPGSSLHANLANQVLTTAGIGNKESSIPVNEIAPQELSKDMTATQGTDHIWTLKKEPTPAHVDFLNTCDPNASLSAAVSIKVTWDKLAASPSGVITVVTHVYATNPAARVVTLDLTDDIRSGTTVLDTATAGPTDLPANSTTLVLTHNTTVPSGTTNLNDVATGTYTDKVTGIPIPGSTTATADAPVQLSGPEANQTASINDIESITGSGLSYSADSFSGASGAFDLGYVAGTKTTGAVSWTSATQSAGSSVTFSKTIYTTSGTSGNGDLADTAALTGSDGFSTSANADITVSTDAKVKLTIEKTIPNVLQGNETQTFSFAVKDSSNVTVATPSISFAAGDTTKSVDVTGLTPGSYTVSEDPTTGWAPQNAQTKAINLPSCSGKVTFANVLSPATAKVKKVTVPAGSEAGWEMTLSGPGTPVGGEKVTTTGTGFVNFATLLQEGSYTITETSQTSWDETASSGCSFTVAYPADAGKTFECTKTNTQRAKIVVKKVTDPNPDPTDTSFSFTAGGGLSPTSFGLKNGGSKSFDNLVPGNGYNVAETVPTGWDLTSSTCDDGSPVTNIALSAGETVTCTFTNTLKRGTIVVKKVTNPSPDPTDTSFSFTAGGGLSPSSFSLKNGGQQTFSNLLPGNGYSAAETVPVGWDLTTSTCDDGSPVTAIDVAAGETVTCTFTNRLKGKIVIKKVTDPSPDPTDTSFSFTAGGGLAPGSFNLKNGGQQTYSNVTPGSGYGAAETVSSGWDLTSSTCDDGSPVSNINVSPGETVTCTFTNRLRGKAKVIKTFSGLPPSGTLSVTFQLRSGASAGSAGTILESGTASAGNGGVINFTTTLMPASTYQLCEVLGPLGPGWMTTLGPPFYSVYNPSGDNSTVCTDFTIAAGETKTFSIDNKPPPGGLALTIGYWKNWSSCTGGGQKPVLDQTLLKAVQSGKTITLGKLVLDPNVLGARTACLDAVALLGKSTLSGKKMASDPLFNMTAQLLAADLNITAGAGACAAAITAINQGHALLTKYGFDGNGYSPKLTSADASLANSLATALDQYNNNKLC